jgi:hypothetical protein
MEWIHLAQDRDQLTLGNTVMNLLDPRKVGNFSTSSMLLCSQEGLFSVELGKSKFKLSA